MVVATVNTVVLVVVATVNSTGHIDAMIQVEQVSKDQAATAADALPRERVVMVEMQLAATLVMDLVRAIDLICLVALVVPISG
jgi:hypothetical protein